MMNTIVLSCLAFVAVSAQMPYNTTVGLKKDVLLDKIKGGWAGQTIGCTYGGPTEFKYKGGLIPDKEPIVWYDDYCKDIFDEDPGLYDDVYMDLTFLEVMQHKGINAPASEYANTFAHAGYKLWHANQASRYNILHGIMPPQSGYWKNNPHADDIDFQIESDFIGMICPGMPQAAAEYADRIGHITNYGDGWYGGVFMGTIYSLAYINNDIPAIISEALKAIPSKSGFYQCISDVIKYWKQYPNDWKRCWLEIQNRYSFEAGCPEGVFNGFDIDAKINAAYCVIGLLYGGGDFYKTMDIATRCGQDSDCNPATAAGILGVINGYKAIPDYWKKSIERCESYKFPYTQISLSSVYGINLQLLEDVVKAHGGKVKGDTYYVKVESPRVVPLEVSFEGLYPVERRVTKFDIGNERSFAFNGNGVVLMGHVREADSGGNPDYVAKSEAYLDGVKIEDITMPYDYITRKYDIFYRYDITEGNHQLKFRWINPDRHFAIQCTDLVIYSSHPQQMIHSDKQ